MNLSPEFPRLFAAPGPNVKFPRLRDMILLKKRGDATDIFMTWIGMTLKGEAKCQTGDTRLP